MDIVYKKGAVNHADARSRRPDLKDSLQKLQLLRDWANDEAKCELHAQLLSLESRLHDDYGLHAEIKNTYDSDKNLLTRKSVPTWLVRQSNGLLYTYMTRQYVPNVSTLRSRVLYELHDAPTAGHHGIIRLLAAVTRAFWWPNMKRKYNTMYVYVLHAKATRQRDTSPMDSFNRTRYRPCPLNTYRLT
jgi:hypothetical protein